MHSKSFGNDSSKKVGLLQMNNQRAIKKRPVARDLLLRHCIDEDYVVSPSAIARFTSACLLAPSPRNNSRKRSPPGSRLNMAAASNRIQSVRHPVRADVTGNKSALQTVLLN